MRKSCQESVVGRQDSMKTDPTPVVRLLGWSRSGVAMTSRLLPTALQTLVLMTTSRYASRSI